MSGIFYLYSSFFKSVSLQSQVVTIYKSVIDIIKMIMDEDHGFCGNDSFNF